MFRRGIKVDCPFSTLSGCDHLLVDWGPVFVVNTLWKLYSCRFFCIIINFYISGEDLVAVEHSRRR